MAMYIVGADCGGTSTTVLVAKRSGEIVGRGKSGPGNYAIDGYDGVMLAVREATAEALAQGGLTWDEMLAQGAALAAGVSGTSIPGAIAKLEKGWQEAGFQTVAVSLDALIALVGALSGGDGAIVISGTGSIGLGQWKGRSVQVGGWGYILGDEGSSFWITREVLRRLLQGRDGIAPRDMALEQAALEHFHMERIDELIKVVYDVPINRGYLGSLTPVVVRLAKEGNSTCEAIIAEAGQELGYLAGAVVRQLDTQGEFCRVGACGGVFSAGSVILEPMQRALAEKAPNAQVTLPDFAPVVGALLVAYGKLGIAPAEILPSLEGSLKERRRNA
ncbi:MAG TPA: hypothetical protein GX008_01130 [Firmicutes bacterium]|nr:hypothetical protein [Bacillota bacterium]